MSLGNRRAGSSRFLAFTVVEMLFVALILSVLMAISMPLYLAAVNDADRKACRANLQTIANAIQASRVSGRMPNYGAFIGGVPGPPLLNDLQTVPKCASNGVYSIQTGSTGTSATYKVGCTIHGTFEPGVDAH